MTTRWLKLSATVMYMKSLKKDIVVDDIVLLEQGEEIPADGILLEAISLQVNESSLTGEPIANKTVIESEFNLEATYPSNHVMRGTTVSDGHGSCRYLPWRLHGIRKKWQKNLRKKAKNLPHLTNSSIRWQNSSGSWDSAVPQSRLPSYSLKPSSLIPASPTPELGQLGLIGALIITAIIMLAKVWVPVIYDVHALRGKEKELPKSIEQGSWARWILYGLGALVIMLAIGLAFGVKPWDPQAWISLSLGKKILSAFMASVTLIVVTVPEGLPMSVTLSLASVCVKC